MRLVPLLLLAALTTACSSGSDKQGEDGATCPDGGAARTWYTDTDGDGYGDPTSPTQSCDAPEGTVSDHTDCDDTTGAVFPNNPEICDGLDNNCDGTPDNSPTDAGSWYVDADQDGYGDPNSPVHACSQPAGTVTDDSDCNDARADALPGGHEVCDGVDNDCNGEVDDDAPDASTYYADLDLDGYGDRSNPVLACGPSAGVTADTSDCDDTSDSVYPGHEELCDTKDNDCNGRVDDNPVDETTFFTDGDGDGFGDASSPVLGCTAPSGSVANGSDCDDANGSVNPRAPELCNSIDDDCDGEVDVGATDAPAWFVDTDGDGYGSDDTRTRACDTPEGYTSAGNDCNDADPAISPAASEVCDEVDNDCDGDVDDNAVDAPTWYADADRDGYGDPSSSSASCDQPARTSADATDCDDHEDRAYPGNAEECDGIDNNCDGTADDGFTPYYVDADGDGYGAGASSCDPTDRVSTNSDCDDTRATVYPGATELCDERANNCTTAASWSQSSENAHAAWEGDDGTVTDLTTTIAAGTRTAPVDVDLPDAGTLRLCRGTWYARVNVSAFEGTVTVKGPSGSSFTSLTSDGTTATPVIASSSGASLVVQGLTISGGAADQGAGISNAYGDLTVSDSVIQGNDATTYGGGIFARVGDVTLDNVTIGSNSSGYTGGGIDMVGGSLTITDGAFGDNTTAWFGGAIHWTPLTAGDALTVDGTDFNTNVVSNSTADAAGGAIHAYIRVDSVIDIANASFSGNSVAGLSAVGGAFAAEVYNGSDTLATFDSVSFDSDSASSTGHTDGSSYAGGGGISWYVYDAARGGASALTLSGVTFQDESVTSSTSADGGALDAWLTDGGGALTLTDVDITSCSVSSTDVAAGGAAFVYTASSATVSVDGGTWSGNSATATNGADGGALMLYALGPASILDTVFQTNTLSATGGGADAGDGLALAAELTDTDLTLSSVTISSNTGSGDEAAFVLLGGTSGLTIDGSTRVASNDGSGVHVASTGAGTLDVSGSVFTQNDTHGLYLEPTGVSFAATLTGSATATQGAYQNGGAGVYMPYTDTRAAYTMTGTSFDLGTEGGSADNGMADLYYGANTYSYSDNATFSCSGGTCS